VLAATLNGRPVEFGLRPAVKECRVVIEAPVAREWRVELKLGPAAQAVTGSLRVLVNQRASFRIANAAVVKVHDPQEKLRESRIDGGNGTPCEVSVVPKQVGKGTVFLELRAGKSSWWQPLDIDVREPWSIIERYIPPATQGGPCVSSPAVEIRQKCLVLEIENNGREAWSGPCKVTVGGKSFEVPANVGAGTGGWVRVPLESVWNRLTPGSLPVTVEWGGEKHAAQACNWDLGKDTAGLSARQLRIDLSPHANAEMKKLFSPQAKWRTDYTGGQHGVDWRHPPPLRDRHGYVLLNNVMSIYDWGVLPEQIQSQTRWDMPELGGEVAAGCGIRFQTVPGKLLALCATEPFEDFSSGAILKLKQPRRLEKLYLLIANLTKTLKSYYPGGEVSVNYADGSAQVHQMIPPYTMPSAVGEICPRAQAIRFGELKDGGSPTRDPHCYLSVVDIVLDPAKPVASFGLRCVATETILGIVGATALEARREP